MEDKPSDRQSIRLDEYDYAGEGAYFITVCTQHKQHRFGYIADGAMHLNEAGHMIAERILAIPAKFPGVQIDAYVVMPNHIHFIVSLLGTNRTGGSGLYRYSGPNSSHVGAAHRGRPLSDRQGRESSDTNIPGNIDASIPDDNVPGYKNVGGPVSPKAGGHDGPPLHVNDPMVVKTSDGNLTRLSDVVGWFKAGTTNYYIKGVKAGRYPVFDKRLWQRNYYEHIIRTEAAYTLIDEYIRTNPERWAEDKLR
ncbi:MAG TPA: hypothetical protein VGA96_06735 [Fibrella sp.]